MRSNGQRSIPVARTIAAAPAYERDERQALALLLLPFLFVALTLGLSQTLKPAAKLIEAVIPSQRPAAVIVPGRIAFAPLSLPTTVPASLAPPPGIVVPSTLEMPKVAPVFPAVAIAPAAPAASDVRIATPTLSLAVAPPAIVLPLPMAEIRLPLAAPEIPVPAMVALAIPVPMIDLPVTAPAISFPVAPPTQTVCLPAAKRAADTTATTAADFGPRLAEAAMAQTQDFVIYSASYKRIAYPMGDVPSLYGACSDLVVRAYRALGIDLQELVQRARVGGGDTNIDHRRTETLRAFFTRHGQSIAPTVFGEDYQPGDIVTYYRPYSRVSRAHIAIVSGRIGPSGNPMIVHNRGWGPQIEDALFVDKVTGHYRFQGSAALTASSGRTLAKPTPRTTTVRVPLEGKPVDLSPRPRKAALAAHSSRLAFEQ